jgi:hypothetical protein
MTKLIFAWFTSTRDCFALKMSMFWTKYICQYKKENMKPTKWFALLVVDGLLLIFSFKTEQIKKCLWNYFPSCILKSILFYQLRRHFKQNQSSDIKIKFNTERPHVIFSHFTGYDLPNFTKIVNCLHLCFDTNLD